MKYLISFFVFAIVAATPMYAKKSIDYANENSKILMKMRTFVATFQENYLQKLDYEINIYAQQNNVSIVSASISANREKETGSFYYTAIVTFTKKQ